MHTRRIRFPLVYDKDGAIQKRYAPGRVTCLIEMNGILRFLREGMPKHEGFLQGPGTLRRRREGESGC